MNISKILDQEQVEKNHQLYAAGLLDVVNFLVVDLWKQLEDENRLRGIVKTYQRKVNTALEGTSYCGYSESEILLFGKILYLHKGLLRKEFSRLVARKLSPADASITIIRRLLNIILEVEDVNNRSDIEKIKEVIDSLWDYIKNRSKNDSLFNLADTVKTNLNLGNLGKYSLDEFTLKEPEYTKDPIQDNGVRLDEGGSLASEILEINM